MSFATLAAAITIRTTSGAPPVFVRRPSTQDLAEGYPRKAKQANVSGSAEMGCDVTGSGTLANCTVQSEDPVGYGFGEAALRLAAKFQLGPAPGESAKSFEGGHLTIPMRFLSPSVPANPIRVSAPQLTGSAAVNCRISPRGVFDNCVLVRSTSPEAAEVALKAVGQMKAPLGAPAGLHVEMPFEFVAAPANSAGKE